jgi:hypothetical protein
MGQLRVKWTGMGKPFRRCAALLFCLSALEFAQQKSPHAGDAVLPATISSPATISTTEGQIELDVSVTDQSGKSVAGLTPTDFTLLDNEQPQKILSFQAVDGKTTNPTLLSKSFWSSIP